MGSRTVETEKHLDNIAVPWGSGQSCWPLEPETAVRIRPGLLI